MAILFTRGDIPADTNGAQLHKVKAIKPTKAKTHQIGINTNLQLAEPKPTASIFAVIRPGIKHLKAQCTINPISERKKKHNGLIFSSSSASPPLSLIFLSSSS
mmetsp:Transcript_8153/g.10397  ORF Transcript_8153/g.10397 Transcript_8153/m.10397 type:complete len:103 (-) Transcript_8153:466-774(-)